MRCIEDFHEWWDDEHNNFNDPARVAWELDHSITRAERAALISQNLERIEEDYSD